ncbi:18S rRNA maturation protein [Kluyveromyces marxianus]|nr:18S rRNA maturation protein [Kluyveromyces marxianus]KAG0678663.1 18S rRNA maturation protein [Kluyveromyces marxianus]
MNPKSKRPRQRHDSSLQLASVIGAGANKIKKQIRNVERLLQKRRDVLPDTVIVEKERMLEGLKFELKEAELRQIGRKNAKKYHMVRFFERKKAMRKYKQASKKVLAQPEDKELQKELREATIDLCYVVNFPRLSKYIALYPATSDSVEKMSEEERKGVEQTNAKRAEFRSLVAKQLDEGTLPVSLEDIIKGKRLNKDSTGVMLEEEQVQEEAMERNLENQGVEEEEDDFFE